MTIARPVVRGIARPMARPLPGVGGSLLDLFRNGEDGFLFGPFDTLERLFLISTGATGNIAANDDPVGLNLDRHSWNGVSLTAILAAQAELLAGAWSLTNGGGTSTATESPSGTITLFHDGTNVPKANQTLSPASTSQKKYEVTFTVSGTATITIGSAVDGNQLLAETTVTNSTVRVFFDAAGATSSVRFRKLEAGTATITAISCKLVPGNHAIQATTTKRPLYKTNSGKPYLNFDGTDDFSAAPCIPGTAGTAAVAFRAGNLNVTALGGGGATGNKRLRLGLADTTGRARVVFNDATDLYLTAGDRRNTNVLIVMTWDATGWAAYLDGATSPTNSAPTVPNMDGAGTSYALGSLEGGIANFLNGPLYAALARNVRSTPSEIALIAREFQRTYQ